jgi:hypothetical protein
MTMSFLVTCLWTLTNVLSRCTCLNISMCPCIIMIPVRILIQTGNNSIYPRHVEWKGHQKFLKLGGNTDKNPTGKLDFWHSRVGELLGGRCRGVLRACACDTAVCVGVCVCVCQHGVWLCLCVLNG